MSNFKPAIGFHDQATASNQTKALFHLDTQFTYKFENFFHPFVGELIEMLNHESLRGMLDAKFHEGLATRFFAFLRLTTH